MAGRRPLAPIRIALVLALCWTALAGAEPRPPAFAVATAHPEATQAGINILRTGGNAFDAAVAVSAMLAVVEPYSSGFGGGGFWLLHRQRDNWQVMVDGRETAPSAAHRDMYLDAQGQVVPGLSVDGALAAGIPGQAAALVHIAETYGKLPLSRSLAPAIEAARNGFEVTAHYQRMAGFRQSVLQQSPGAAELFLENGEIPAIGSILRQPDLARVLEEIARHGRQGFYQGWVAQKLVEEVQQAGGIWTLKDLRHYQVRERRPLISWYRGARIISAPPPSSGGVALAGMFNMLTHFSLPDLPVVTRIHLLSEVMRRAYRDRAMYLGDSDYYPVPVSRLTGPLHGRELASSIRRDAATPSADLGLMDVDIEEGNDTTHFSILDQEGNRVAATLSINYPFGSGFVAAGTGILLNDEMDDFSAKPGVPNVYGLVGGEANAIAPGKRMLSSMSPTFVESEQGVAILGTPGGSRIISMVLLGILEHLRGRPVQDWVSRPRFHHQYLPDLIQFEPGAINPAQQDELRSLGHALQEQTSRYGNMQAVFWDRKRQRVTAASDPRVEGMAMVRSVTPASH